MTGRLEGKVAVITGATSGIGKRTAERFVEEGARVVLASRSEDKGAALSESLGDSAVFRVTDVAEEARVRELVELCLERFGRLDCMFNNAGIATLTPTIADVTPEIFRTDMDILAGGVLWGMKHAAPVMREQGGGSIINNASIGGIHAGYSVLVYSAAKAAVIHMTRCVSLELAKDRVRVNSISPGGIVTPIFGRVFGMDRETAERTADKVEGALVDATPIGRAGTVDDIANAALYLASDESSFITGHDLVVDGGTITGRRPEESDRIYGKMMQDLGLVPTSEPASG